MNRIGFKGVLFVIAISLNFALPATMIYQQARTLKEGDLVRFRTRPIDPYDPFRGRYVRLGFEGVRLPLEDGERVVRGDTIFVSIEIDEQGFAQLREALRERPSHGLYVKAKAGWMHSDSLVNIELPFQRYYMNEQLAPDAERAYREANLANPDNPDDPSEFQNENYALVRIRNGATALEAVHLRGKPIEEYLKEIADAEEQNQRN